MQQPHESYIPPTQEYSAHPPPTTPPPTGPPKIPAQDSYYYSTSPRPLHYSPLNKPPTPYNASRPRPRPNFIQRCLLKIERWIKKFIRWAKHHPIIAGFFTFLPVAGLAGAVKAGKMLRRSLGGRQGKIKGGSRSKGAVDEGGIMKRLEKALSSYGFHEFRGFGGTNGGALDGILKVVHLFM
jgi:hypothetical protein